VNPHELVPHSQEAEQSLIGGLLLDPTSWDRIELDPAACYVDAHRIILAHIESLILASKTVDIVTVFESLERSGDSERVGGLAYLGELVSNTASAVNAHRYAEIIRERAVLRALIAAGADIQGMALAADGGTAEDRVSAAATRVATIAEGCIRGTGPAGMDTVVSEALEHLQQLADGDVKRYETGLTDLDRVLYSYSPGSLVLIAGRPGMGKTSLAMQCAEHCAQDGKQGAVAVFSMEMPRRELALRSISRIGRIPIAGLVEGNLSEDEWAMVTFATGVVSKMGMYIDETPALRLAQVRARCSVVRRKAGGLKLIVIDYLQLMRGDGENRTQEIGGISRGLKALAKEMQCPVIALSQLNRKLEDRPNKRPHMSDLRESGDLEQDADLILFAYRDEVYNKDSDFAGTAEIIVGKQRMGPAGDEVRVAWVGKHASFENLSKDWRAPEVERPKRSSKGFS
jgi:replicative DNA helicase